MSSLVVAIDGPAGSGKSTVARAVADALGWSYLDTGAMYRAVTSEALRTNTDVHDGLALFQLARTAVIDTKPRVRINGRDVEDEIRSPEVNLAVSVVAADPGVRRVMVEHQRAFAQAEEQGTVVEGRDITTVVFPNATLKVYLTATPEERARRRGDEAPESIARRDHTDATRDNSPLRQAEDAIVIDTTGRDVDAVVEEIVTCLKNRHSN